MTSHASDRVRRLLAGSTFELIPLDGAFEQARYLPIGTPVSVTASPSRGAGATVRLSALLTDAGFEAVPHLAARRLTGMTQLESIIHDLAGCGVRRVFVVAGDDRPEGPFADSLELMDAMDAIGHPFAVGVGGYPEGHPTIADAAVRAALIAKADRAQWITTQMCFDVEAIARWVLSIRRDGVQVPVVAGIPGVVDAIRLARVGARIGVGESLRFLGKHGSAIRRLVTAGRFEPQSLVQAIGSLDVDELGITGLHVFTFNQVQATSEWYLQALDTAAED